MKGKNEPHRGFLRSIRAIKPQSIRIGTFHIVTGLTISAGALGVVLVMGAVTFYYLVAAGTDLLKALGY